MLVARELLEDSQFPIIERDLLEAKKYTTRICNKKIFSVLMDMTI